MLNRLSLLIIFFSAPLLLTSCVQQNETKSIQQKEATWMKQKEAEPFTFKNGPTTWTSYDDVDHIVDLIVESSNLQRTVFPDQLQTVGADVFISMQMIRFVDLEYSFFDLAKKLKDTAGGDRDVEKFAAIASNFNLACKKFIESIELWWKDRHLVRSNPLILRAKKIVLRDLEELLDIMIDFVVKDRIASLSKDKSETLMARLYYSFKDDINLWYSVLNNQGLKQALALKFSDGGCPAVIFYNQLKCQIDD